tara:strand:+ start:333 stop:458 length:126 start_codon:yes stop_codon:yes gene_type:complete
MITISDALQALTPSAQWVIRGEVNFGGGGGGAGYIEIQEYS